MPGVGPAKLDKWCHRLGLMWRIQVLPRAGPADLFGSAGSVAYTECRWHKLAPNSELREAETSEICGRQLRSSLLHLNVGC